MKEIPHRNFKARRLVSILLLAVSIGLLIPGLIEPVITIQGALKPEGIAHVVPELIEKGLDRDTVKVLEAMMSSDVLKMLKATGCDLRKTIIAKLVPKLTVALQKDVQDIKVYEQTRSIVGSVWHLYEVQSYLPATLILIFSVVVPLAKAMLVLWATFQTDAAWRRRTLGFVELIAKWSMADVFVVALFITYLAAQASQTPPCDPNGAPPMVAFTVGFGAGFYWFATYCTFSLAAQQFTSRWFAHADPLVVAVNNDNNKETI